MPKRKECQFCKRKVAFIDYKDASTLSRYLSGWAKIRPGKDTGACSRHQRDLTEAIKRARFLALLPYTTR
jgi:small subunit ribosomal protein S18